MKRRILRTVLVLAIVLVVVAVGVGYWIAYTPGGAQLVLGRLADALGKGAKVEGVEGSLGGPLRVKLIIVDRPDFYVRVDDVEMQTSFLSPLRREPSEEMKMMPFTSCTRAALVISAFSGSESAAISGSGSIAASYSWSPVARPRTS